MTRDRIAERAAEHLASLRPFPRFKTLSDAEREAWARDAAERDLAKLAWLPGGLSWSQIEATFRKLAGQPPGLGSDGHSYRRRRRDLPSRPEVAAALMTSPATLRRACVAFGRGASWPPRGLTSKG
jgi:hypothetical protein